METKGRVRKHSSPSLSPKGEHPIHPYGSRGTYGTRPHYLSGSSRSSSHHRDYSQYEQRRSPHGHSINDCACTGSSLHHHTHQCKHQHSAHNSDGATNNKRKATTNCICTPEISPAEPTEPWNSNDEWQATDSDSESTNSKQYSAGTNTRRITPTSNKRARASSDDESEYTSDVRQESKYGGKSDYKPGIQIYNRSRSDYPDSHLDDHGYHKEHEQGRGRYEHGRGQEGSGYHNNQDERQGDSTFNSSALCKKKLWVGALPSDITCEEIRKYFEVYGKLVYVMISPKGNAFVKFATEAQALFAYRKCYTAYIRGKLVKVKYAIRKANKIPHNKLLYINNVPPTCTRTELKKEFEKYGEIEDVQMFTVPYLYFFVTFVSEDSAVKARKALKTKYFIQFGKNRTEDKREPYDSPEAAQPKEPSREQLPDISECKVCDVLEPLSESQTLELSDLLNALRPTNAAIRIRRDWILDHVANINDILLHISVMLVAKDNPFTLRLSTLFLIHDLLSYCTQRRVCTEILDTVSALTLPHLQRVINKFHVDSEEERKPVLNILSLWEKYSVFPVSVVENLRLKFTAGEQDSQRDEFW